MPVDIEQIRRLSPAALRIFKEQSLRKARTGDQTYARMVSMPELADIFQQGGVSISQPQEQETPWWQHPLNWIRGVEKGFGAAVTAPFTPSVVGTENLPWFEREKAEYKAWDEPSFQVEPAFRLPWTSEEVRERPWTIGVKGVVETLPWFATALASGGLGLAGKVPTLARAAGLGERALTPIIAAEKAITMAPFKAMGIAGRAVVGKGVIPTVEKLMPRVGKLSLPSKEVLNEALYKQDFFRKFAQWSETKPVINRVVKAIGGESAFVRAESMLPEDIVKREIVNRAVLMETAQDAQGLLMPRLNKFGHPRDVLGIGEDWTVKTAIPKRKGLSNNLWDILENPDGYKFTSVVAKDYVKELHAVLREVKELAIKEGVPVPKGTIVHRMVIGKETEKGFEKTEFGSLFETQRTYATAESGVKAGVVYGLNPNESVAITIRHYISKIANKRFNDEIKKLGKTALQKFAEAYPEEALRIAQTTTRQIAAKNALGIVQRVLSYKATRVPGATMAKIRAELPDIAGKMDILFELAPNNVDKLIVGMGKELRIALRTSPKELKQAVDVISKVQETWRGVKKITMLDIEDAISNLNIDKDVAARLITRGYRETYKENRKFFKDFMTVNRDYLRTVIEKTKETLSPLKSGRSQFLKKYRYGGQILGEQEAMFKRHPVFRDLIFDKDVVSIVEEHLADKGSKWIRDLGAVSSISRMLTAALDFSAPFIQGLAVLGRKPLIWGKSTLRQFDFFLNPENLQKYMTKPEVMAIRAERFAAGGSMQGFEFFESMLPMQQVVGKVPKVGGALQTIVRQTYGRGEAAFSGFGEVARNEMWAALKKPTMGEVELRELARTIDRMTGVMSSKALGIRMTQGDLEGAFVFFAPRYTRASLSYVADIFKGGMSGAEARKSLAGLMASGTAMYYGICRATGQEPNFDPSSAKFMTIQVDEDRVGIGGMLYGLARLGANLVGMDSPTDLLKLDRFDNPFIKFMYAKSSPLTGLIVGAAIEQRNYFGEPFETTSDWAKFLAEKVMPFATQQVLEDERVTVAGVGTQLAGMRTFPMSDWDRRNEIRDKLAQETYGMDWEEVGTQKGKLYQQQLEIVNPELEEATTLANETSSKMARGEGKVWDVWKKDGQAIEDRYRNALTVASREFEVTHNGVMFKDKVDSASDIRRAMYDQREKDSRYGEINQYFTEPLEPQVMAKMNPNDLARREYYQMMYSPDMTDEFGNYRFEEADRREAFFVQKYGEQALDYVEKYMGAKWEEPTAVKMLRQARKILEPYWNIENQIWANFPPQLKQIANQIQIMERADPNQAKRMLFQYPQIVMARKQIALYRKQIKMVNPDIANALRMFYSY